MPKLSSVMVTALGHYSTFAREQIRRRMLIDQWESELVDFLDVNADRVHEWSIMIEKAASEQTGYYSLFSMRFIYVTNEQFGNEARARVRDKAMQGQGVRAIEAWVMELPKRLTDELHLESVNYYFSAR